MIVYAALPYLLVAAPAVIVLLAVLIGGCPHYPPEADFRARPWPNP